MPTLRRFTRRRPYHLDLHPSPYCENCDMSYEAGGVTNCAGYAWVTTSGPDNPLQKYMHMAGTSLLIVLSYFILVPLKHSASRAEKGNIVRPWHVP